MNIRQQEQLDHDSGWNDDIHNIMREEARDIGQEIQDRMEAEECAAARKAFVGPPAPPKIQAALDANQDIPF